MNMGNQLDDDNMDEKEIEAERLTSRLPPAVMLNSDIIFSNIRAHEPETILCIRSGNCAMDKSPKGLIFMESIWT